MAKKRPNGYWDNPENVDRAYDEMKAELGRTPTYKEFTKYGGAIAAIVHGMYHPKVRTFNDYLSHRGEKLNNEIGKWTPEEVDRAYDELKSKLGRTPTYKDVQGSCGGMLAAIIRGNYNHDVRTWNQYLTYRNQKLNNEFGRWTPENIDKAFDELKAELGRVPKQEEFYAGALSAIGNGRYSSDIKNWNQYLVHRGESVVSWTPEKIDKVFDGLVEKLGRTPTVIEFGREYPGAWSAVTAGNYHPDVKGWKSFLLHKGLESSRRDWTPEAVDKAYDELREKLGRVPVVVEFAKKYAGAINMINKGTYDKKIKNWNEYLIHRGEKPNQEPGRWTPENIDKAFDELKAELGRVPTAKEFNRRTGGAMGAINKGRYHPDVHSWNGYLVHRDEKLNKPDRTSLNFLEDLLEDEDE